MFGLCSVVGALTKKVFAFQSWGAVQEVCSRGMFKLLKAHLSAFRITRPIGRHVEVCARGVPGRKSSSSFGRKQVCPSDPLIVPSRPVPFWAQGLLRSAGAPRTPGECNQRWRLSGAWPCRPGRPRDCKHFGCSSKGLQVFSRIVVSPHYVCKYIQAADGFTGWWRQQGFLCGSYIISMYM